jgi:hypothetical protein
MQTSHSDPSLDPLDTKEVLKMRRLTSVKTRTKFVAAAVLSAGMLAFVGDASAQQAKDTGTVVVMPLCRCEGGLSAEWCLANYCYTETVCSDCQLSRVEEGEGEGGGETVFVP